MTSIILSNNVMTVRKQNQTIKSHINDHYKITWLTEYMRIAQCNYETALAIYEGIFK